MEDKIKTSDRSTDYKPINCGLYDHFEAAAVKREKVVLEILNDDGTTKKYHHCYFRFFSSRPSRVHETD